MCPVHHLAANKSKRTKERLRLTVARLKTFLWTESDDVQFQGFGFISDFSESSVGVYLAEKLSKGNHVRVAFESAEGEAYRGEVIWCNRYTLDQHFVGHRTMSYRVGIKLRFSSEAERQRYSNYYASIKARTLLIKPGMEF